jgi:hypothetical protein
MKKVFLFSILASLLVSSGGVLRCQQLIVQIGSGKQVVLNRADLEALPHIKVTAATHSSDPVIAELNLRYLSTQVVSS